MAWIGPSTRAVFPVKGGFIAAPYHQARKGAEPHKGADIAAKAGSAVLAILPAVVVATYQTGQLTGYGNLVVLKHGPDAFSLYAHLDTILVRPDQTVEAGAPIGTVGTTAGTPQNPQARNQEAHLHLECLTRWPPASRYSDRVDPELVLGHDFGPSTPAETYFSIRPYRQSKAALGPFIALLGLALLLKARA